MEEQLIALLKAYGLPGLVASLVALYVWRVKIPADAKLAEAAALASQKVAETAAMASQKRDDFIQTLVIDGTKKSEALIQAFRDDIRARDDKFVKAITDVEESHRAGQSEIADAIREMRDKRASGGRAA